MHVCPECRRGIDDHDSLATGFCPYCRSDLPDAGSPDWTSVARVANLAEAGFLCDELSTLGIENRLVQSESFSALSGGWSAAYVIQVSPDDATAATSQLKSHLSEVESDRGDREFHRPLLAGDDHTIDPVFWRPVALMLIAGVASFALGRQMPNDRNPRQPAPRRGSMSMAIEAIGRPLVTEPNAAGACHRLIFDDRQRCWYLETDGDGDGRFERRQRFHEDGARW